MTTAETFQKLSDMRLHAFAHALKEQLDTDHYDQLGFDERVGLMVDREWNERETRSLTRRLQLARLRDRTACVEDIDYNHPRDLDRSLLRRLSTCEWIKKHQNLIISGKTGCGKTFIACAIANKACREGFSVIYRRLPRLLHELQLARGDGSWPRLLSRWAKTDVLIIDDWGISPLTSPSRGDLLEIVEDRHGERSTVIAGQLPIAEWHKYIGDPAIADATLDRVVHNAHHIKLKGESIRKKRSDLTKEENSAN